MGAASALGDEETRNAAEALFDAGRDALKEGRLDEACSRFEASNQLDAAVGTIFNLANCNEQRGRLAAALSQYREVAERLPEGDPRGPVAVERVHALEQRVPYLTLKLAHTAPAGTAVLLDGKDHPPQSFGVAVPVEMGEHRILVRAAGRADGAYRVVLAEAQRAEVVLEPGALTPGVAGAPPAAPASAPGSAAVDTASPAPTPLVGYVVGGIGVAALGTSLVTGILASSKESTVNDACRTRPGGGGRYCTEEGLAAADSGRTLATVSDVTLGLGLVGVGFGVWWIFFHAEQPQDAPAASATPLPGGARLDVRGTF